jgi:hypothetical protein
VSVTTVSCNQPPTGKEEKWKLRWTHHAGRQRFFEICISTYELLPSGLLTLTLLVRLLPGFPRNVIDFCLSHLLSISSPPHTHKYTQTHTPYMRSSDRKRDRKTHAHTNTHEHTHITHTHSTHTHTHTHTHTTHTHDTHTTHTHTHTHTTHTNTHAHTDIYTHMVDCTEGSLLWHMTCCSWEMRWYDVSVVSLTRLVLQLSLTHTSLSLSLSRFVDTADTCYQLYLTCYQLYLTFNFTWLAISFIWLAMTWDGMRLWDGTSLWQFMPSWAKWWTKSQLSDELSHTGYVVMR